jgi:Zn finger protein HypA/HybF involved in hydrogenase expression
MLAAIALTILFTLGYVGLCAAVPFARCRRCGGFGAKTTTNRRGTVRRGNTCRRCHGHGVRIRTGRHLFNLARGIHHDGTR